MLYYFSTERAPHVPLFEQPKNQSVRVGETAIFSCRIDISDTHPHIQWLKHHQVNGSYTNENGEQYFQIIQVSHVQICLNTLNCFRNQEIRFV